jgi:hypothetical protein
MKRAFFVLAGAGDAAAFQNTFAGRHPRRFLLERFSRPPFSHRFVERRRRTARAQVARRARFRFRGLDFDF